MLHSKHVINVILDQVKYRAEEALKELNDTSKDIAKDRSLTSVRVGEFIGGLVETLMSFYSRDERNKVFNSLAKDLSIKVNEDNTQ